MSNILRLIGTLFLLAPLSQPALAQEVTLDFQGMTLNGNLELADEKSLADPVILMVHGTLAHNGMEIQKTLQEMLRERAVNTLTITLSLGISNRKGFYDCAQPHNHQHTDALAEIAAWIDWLKGQGSKTIYLLGHSRGGNQVAWYATENKQPLVKGVILVAPMNWDEQSEAVDYRKRYEKDLAPLLADAEKRMAEGKGQEWLEHTDFIYCKDTKVSAASFVSYYKPDKRRHTPGLLKSIPQKTLVFAGSADTSVVGLEKQVPPVADGEHIQFQLIDGADHFFRDLYAEDVADAILAFMAE